MLAGWGCFLLLLGLFLFTHPGRIDMLDGQYRYDVSRNILDQHGPVLTDPQLTQWPAPKNPKTGTPYSYYTAPASLLPLPLMALGRLFLGAKVASDRFSFSLVSAFVGALIAPLLLMFYRRLGVSLKRSIGWALAFSVTTLWWPFAETIFDQCQHGVVLLAMVIAAFDTARDRRWMAALLAGLLGGLLFNYRTPFIFLLPFVPLYWRTEFRKVGVEKRVAFQLNAVYAAGIGVGVVGFLFYNWIRFGQPGMPAYYGAVPTLGSPVFGFLTLMVSPGKGVFWFSPPLILGVAGLAGMLKPYRALAILIVSVSLMHIAEMSCLTFAGGDWCWGPRYMVPLLPLWALAFPFVSRSVFPKVAVLAVLFLGLVVQVIGNAVDYHRFFYFRRLSSNFWLDSYAYFKRSQLASRPAEILETVSERNVTRPLVNSNPTNEATYCPFGPSEKVDPQEWQKQFRIFYLPRPWWGWVSQVPEEQRPVDPTLFLIACCIPTGIGFALLRRARPKAPPTVA